VPDDFQQHDAPDELRVVLHLEDGSRWIGDLLAYCLLPASVIARSRGELVWGTP